MLVSLLLILPFGVTFSLHLICISIIFYATNGAFCIAVVFLCQWRCFCFCLLYVRPNWHWSSLYYFSVVCCSSTFMKWVVENSLWEKHENYVFMPLFVHQLLNLRSVFYLNWNYYTERSNNDVLEVWTVEQWYDAMAL